MLVDKGKIVGIVDKLLSDAEDRSLLDGVDDDVREEIKHEWVEMLYNEIGKLD